jgi:nitrite reductase/ring-hydroxylating ferredoxin subunit
MSEFLTNFWYLAVTAGAVTYGKPMPVTLLGRDILLGRKRDGTAFAYADHCPHRGMPLRNGSCDGETLQCCYHGWRFSINSGGCVEIPALATTDAGEPGRFSLREFPCRDVQGNIWVFMGDSQEPFALPPVPTVPGFDCEAPHVSVTMRFPCAADVATTGFFDPAHPPFVHTSRWWRRHAATTLRPKEKIFEPHAMGFRMKRHQLNHGANPYRLFGRQVSTEITIQLPGLRVEHVHGERHTACVLAAATPITATTTDVHYCVYWTIGWLSPLKPLARWMTRDFLRQDYEIAVKLGPAAQAFPPSVFSGDADAQIRWSLHLKQEYEASRADNRPFRNPLREEVLRWRS